MNDDGRFKFKQLIFETLADFWLERELEFNQELLDELSERITSDVEQEILENGNE
jgi:hypothetical protein